MALDYYQLLKESFSFTPEPPHLFPSAGYRYTLAALYRSVLNGSAISVLVAGPGVGKTTLLHDFGEQLRNVNRQVLLSVADYDIAEVFRGLLANLGISVEQHDLPSMCGELRRALLRAVRDGRIYQSGQGLPSVVIIDEAQALSNSAIEALRVLANLGGPSGKMVQLVMAGQPQLTARLADRGLQAFREQVSGVIRLDPLSGIEINEYINHRLHLAGYFDANLFTADARKLIARWSNGIPARINILCLDALKIGAAEQERRINWSIVREAIASVDPNSRMGQAGPIYRWTQLVNLRTQSLRILALGLPLVVAFTAILAFRTRFLAMPAKTDLNQSKSDIVGLFESKGIEQSAKSPHPGTTPPSPAASQRAGRSEGDYTSESSGENSVNELTTTIIVPANSDLQSEDTNSARISVELKRGDAFMQKGAYDNAIRTFETASGFQPTRKDINKKLERARRAKATERRVLGQ